MLARDIFMASQKKKILARMGAMVGEGFILYLLRNVKRKITNIITRDQAERANL